VRLVLSVDTDTFSYELLLGLPPHQPGAPTAFKLDPEVKEERVWMKSGAGKVTFFERKPGVTWIRDREGVRGNYSGELYPTESVLSQLREPHLYPELSTLRSEMAQWRFYHHFRTDTDSPLRRPQVGVRTPVLAHDGRDLAAALQTIFEVGAHDALNDAVAEAFGGARLIIEHSDAWFSVGLDMPSLSRTLDSRELSDGTLRYLCLLAALLSPRPPSLLALNEPETSLHPDLLEPLAKMMVAAATRSQLWVVTHSLRLAELVERHSKQSPIRLELHRGETRIVGQGLIDSE
jgi:predicted ATPase